MLSSPGCWKVYGEILAKEYSGEFWDDDTHRLTVDSYAAQHPGSPEDRRAAQSVHIHLMSLYLVLEKGFSGQKATECIKRTVESKTMTSKLRWLEPPSFKDTVTVSDVVTASNLVEHSKAVRKWAESVWQAWKKQHGETIAEFACAVKQGTTGNR